MNLSNNHIALNAGLLVLVGALGGYIDPSMAQGAPMMPSNEDVSLAEPPAIELGAALLEQRRNAVFSTR